MYRMFKNGAMNILWRWQL